jgi:6-phosphogluconolactonase
LVRDRESGEELVVNLSFTRAGDSQVASPNLVISPDNESLNRKAAEYFVAAAREAIAARGRFTVALSGGSTPKTLYEMLASPPWRTQIDWGNVHVFWGDERMVPPDDNESNYRMTNLALLSKVPVVAANVHRVVTEVGDADAAAAAYEETIRRDFNPEPGEVPRLDLNLLGLGTNGHTASLFPHTQSLEENVKLVVAEFVAEVKQHRITMTVPLINHSRHIVFLVSGASKAAVVKDVITGPKDQQRLPAQFIQPVDGTLVWMLDQAAAAELPARL